MDNIRILTGQVKVYLIERHEVNINKYDVYDHFRGQCNQFEINEDEFYKDVLKPAYNDVLPILQADDPDPRNEKHTHISYLQQKIHSLKRLGTLLFENPDQAVDYFEDMSLLKTHVDTLSTADDALAYAKLYKSEPETQKRYLRIVYHLNPKLPYRIGGVLFKTLEEILDKAFADQEFYNQVYNEFAAGKLLVWLSESHPELAAKLPAGKNYNSFLHFIYKVNAAYPFYLGNQHYADAHEIVGKAQKDIAFRKELYAHIQNEKLFTWFESIGNADWAVQYLAAAAQIEQKKLEGEELVTAAVQKLIRIIEPGIAAPQLKASVETLSFTNIEAGKIVVIPVTVKLSNSGYVKARIERDRHFDGIWIDSYEFSFFDLANTTETTFNLYVEPLQLTKDKLYEFGIKIITDYQTIQIPVEIKTVFPVRAFVLHLAKYGAIGFALMGLIRYLLQALTKTEWLEPNLILANFNSALPENYPAYIVVFLLLIVVFAGILPLIKKVEKI